MLRLPLLLLLFFTSFLSINSQAYYDQDQGLLFGVGEASESWRLATETEISTLFGGELFNGILAEDFNQSTADAILSLGGSGSFTDTTLTCDALPGLSCEELEQICTVNPAFTGCSTLAYVSSGGLLTLTGLRLADQEYSVFYQGSESVWSLDLTGPPEALSDYCGEPGGTSCDLSQLLVSTVPVPAAAWLFGSALIGLVGIKRKR